jgi:hypothetical protein
MMGVLEGWVVRDPEPPEFRESPSGAQHSGTLAKSESGSENDLDIQGVTLESEGLLAAAQRERSKCK